MKQILLSALAAIAGCSSAHAVVLDFETDAGGNPVTRLTSGSVPDHTPFLVGNTYSSLGVVFSSEGDAPGTDLGPIFGNMTGSTGSNTVVQDYKRDIATGSSFNIRADFTGSVTDVAVDVFAATGQTVTMSAFDSLGSALGSTTSGALSFGTGEALSLSGIGDISYLLWEASSPFASSVGIDNLSFNTPPVSLPAGGLLLVSGLAGLGWMRRRRSA